MSKERHDERAMSPDVQREKIEQWAAYRGYTITRWYIDLDRPASKGSPPRPEFDRMMADARDRHFEVVAVYRLTRFARSMAQAASAYTELEKLDVGLVSVTEDIDSTTVAGNLMRNILFALAEFESERIGEEWRNVHAARRRRGIAHVARPTFGFIIDGAVIVGLDPAEAVAVREIYQLRAFKGYDLGQLQDWLYDHGHRPKRSRGSHFAKSTLRRILTNPLYAGLVEVDGELIEATHEAIVPRDVWDAVQATWRRTTSQARHTSSSALLSGLLVCGGCGYRMHYEGDRKGRYRCPARNLSQPCPEPTQILSKHADPYVEKLFLRRFSAARMPHGGKLRQTRSQQTWRRRAEKLRTRSDELTNALDSLADQRYVKGTLEAGEYDRQFARYAQERLDVEAEAEELEARAASIVPLQTDALTAWPVLSTTAKRRALRLLIGDVECRRGDPAKRGRYADGPEKRLEIHWLR